MAAFETPPLTTMPDKRGPETFIPTTPRTEEPELEDPGKRSSQAGSRDALVYEINPLPVAPFTIAALRRASMNKSSHSPTSTTSI